MRVKMAKGNRTFPRTLSKSPSVALAVWYGKPADIDAPQWIHEVEPGYEERRIFYETRGVLCNMFAALANRNQNAERSNAIHRWVYNTSVSSTIFSNNFSS